MGVEYNYSFELAAKHEPKDPTLSPQSSPVLAKHLLTTSRPV